jgi:hypothetical protein
MPAPPSAGWDRFDRLLRVIVFVAVGGVVIGAMSGLAGLSTTTTSAANGNILVLVEHAAVTRPGLATPLSIEVRTIDRDELPGEVIVQLSRRYLDAFDENGLDPEPAAISSDGETEWWTFEPAGQAVLAIDFDARLQPNIHSSRRTDIVVQAGADRVVVPIMTRVRP